MPRLGLFLLLLCSIISLHAEELSVRHNDTSALFDGNEATLWLGSGAFSSFVHTPVACFDKVTIVSSGNHLKDVSRVGFKTLSGELQGFAILPCSVNDTQVVSLSQPICDTVVVHLVSCSEEVIALREIIFNRVQTKRAVQQCATEADCAEEIGLGCTGGVCTKRCKTHADCTNPNLPQCDFSTGACTVGCAKNEDCSHIASTPYCNLNAAKATVGICWPNQCIPDNGNGDCFDPLQPVCFSATGDCIKECLRDDDCANFPGNYRCQRSTGECVYSCRYNEDCRDNGLPPTLPPQPVANPVCNLASNPPTCVACTSNADCFHLWGRNGICDQTMCKYAQCYNDEDCIGATPDPYSASKCVNNACVSCGAVGDSSCSHFSIRTFCDGTKCVMPCKANADCLVDSSTGAPLPLATAQAASRCDTSTNLCGPCQSDNDCGDFNFNPPARCVGGTCTAVQCVENDDCTTLGASTCSNYQCVPCTNSFGCSHMSVHIVCVAGTCSVPTCISNSECSNPLLPVCIFPNCVAQCKSFPDACNQFFAESWCSNDGTCKAPSCRNHEDCVTTPATPKCASLDGVQAPQCMVGCATNLDCQNYSHQDNARCVNGACVVPECTVNLDCKDVTRPRCDIPTLTCVACSTDAHCSHFLYTRKCITTATSGTCFASCSSDAECTNPAFPKCTVGGTANNGPVYGCTASCSTQTHPCHQFVNRKCNTGTGQCVTGLCKTNQDCTDPTKSKCDLSLASPTCVKPANCDDDTTCTQFFQHTFCKNGICLVNPGGCLSERDCKNPLLPYCNPATNACEDDCTKTTDKCARFEFANFCSPDRVNNARPCVIPECRSNVDCGPQALTQLPFANTFSYAGAYTRSYCSLSKGRCQGCRNDDDCQYWSVDQLPGFFSGQVSRVASTITYSAGSCLNGSPTFTVYRTLAGEQSVRHCGAYCNTPVIAVSYESATVIRCWCSNSVPSGGSAGTCSFACPAGGGNCGSASSLTTLSVYNQAINPNVPLAPYPAQAPGFSQTRCFIQSGLPDGICAPSCRSNLECTNPLFPVCTQIAGQANDVRACTASCSSNDDCSQFTSAYWCDGATGTCIIPECLTNQDCKADPAKSMCDTSGPHPVCTGCSTDDQCAHLVLTPICNKPNNHCIAACHDNTDCKDPNFPVCNVCDDSRTGLPCLNPGVPNACQPVCRSNDDCAQFFYHTICDYNVVANTGGKCVTPAPAAPLQCRKSDDCLLPSLPFCNKATNFCTTGCTTHHECTRFHDQAKRASGSTPTTGHQAGVYKGYTFCVTNAGSAEVGTCVKPECRNDFDCPSAALPICVDPLNGLSPTCQATCTNQNQCARFAYETYCTGGACVIPVCDDHMHCPPEMPVCSTVGMPTGISWDEANTNARVCSPCTNHDQCAKFSYFQKTWCFDGACVEPECAINFDCPDPLFPVCVVPDFQIINDQPDCKAVCQKNQDCVQYDKLGTTWCDLGTGTCVHPPCLEDEDCPLPTVPMCDLTRAIPVCTTGCTRDEHCVRFATTSVNVEGTFVCRAGICVNPLCLKNEDCPADKPVCNVALNPPSCEATCQSDKDCVRFTGVQLPGKAICILAASADARKGQCVAPGCIDHVDCPAATPWCDFTLNPPACIAKCQTNDDCFNFALEMICSANRCVKPACTFDRECPGTQSCDPGTRTCVACYFDSHCPAGQVCNTHLHTCISGCNRDSDCTNPATPSCLVKTHTCVACIDDRDCPNASSGNGNVACDPARNVCVACNEDSHCFGRTPSCDVTRHLCVECLTHQHCSGTKAVCHPGSRTCIQCATNEDCRALNPSGGQRTCNPGTHLCVDCFLDSDCNFADDKKACVVASNKCAQCTSDRHCAGLPGTPACDLGTNTCVECTSRDHCPDHRACDVSALKCLTCTVDSDCPSATPACDPISGQCVACVNSAHCTAPTAPACDVAAQQCVACISDEHCPDMACDVSTHSCVECTSNEHCGEGHVCDSSARKCVECLADKDCDPFGAAPFCSVQAGSANTCVGCTNDGQCKDFDNPVCDVDSHTCVTCSKSADCWLRDAANPICREGTCGPCKTDNDCIANFITNQACDDNTGVCVPDQYRKGFYISAVVLGSIAIFLVTGALIAIVAGAAAS